MKIIDKTRLNDTTSQLLSREISCMEKLCHQNLIKLFEIHETFSSLSLVMECAAEGNLQSRVEDNGPLPEAQAKAVFSQIAAGVAHMVISILIYDCMHNQITALEQKNGSEVYV